MRPETQNPKNQEQLQAVAPERAQDTGLDRDASLPTQPHDAEHPRGNDNAETPSERFHELIDGVDDERLDAIARRLADPSDPAHAEEVQWRDDPDPFGINWAWAKPQADSHEDK